MQHISGRIWWIRHVFSVQKRALESMTRETGEVVVVTAIHRSIDIILKSNIFECSTSFECRLPNMSSRHTSMQQVSGLTFYLPHFVLFFDCILLIVFQPFSALDVIPFKHQVSITISLVENRFLSFFSRRGLHSTTQWKMVRRECRTVNKCLKQFYSWKSVWSILKWSIKWLR